MTKFKKTALLGFGNPARSDDGVGCYVIQQLKEQYQEKEGLTLIDMGTSAFEVLFQLKGNERIIFIDGVINTGEPDGTLYHLPASEIDAAIQEDPMVFLHSLKWDQALSYAKKILQDDYPEDIGVYLIAISNTKMDIGMSPQVVAAADQLVGIIAKQLEEEAHSVAKGHE
ncbi:MAG: hydrogenase maturation protease [Bacteroidetes bacterium]|jgi:hydrogenase maturation protease|nr:hydrogenase maturation protease [Bacteroidota bacterium]